MVSSIKFLNSNPVASGEFKNGIPEVARKEPHIRGKFPEIGDPNIDSRNFLVLITGTPQNSTHNFGNSHIIVSTVLSMFSLQFDSALVEKQP